jgi:hypothetical protein
MLETFASTGIPIIGSIGEGYQRKADLKRQRKEMEVAAALEIMASKKQARKVVGSYVSDVGASGVDLTLDEIGEVNKEYALDQAITFDYAQRQSDLMRTAGNKAVTAGWIKGGMEAGSLVAGAMTGGATTVAGQSQKASATSQSIDTKTSSMVKKRYNSLNQRGTGSLAFGGMGVQA